MGYITQPFKVGPDYIDPGYLSSAARRTAKNLDVWLMGQDRVLTNFASASSFSNISIIEGVMGYYDGLDGNTNYASTFHVASITKSPVLLIIDASRTARSVAATALGFCKFHKNSRIVGVILNKIASKRHELLCRSALDQIKIPVVGAIPRDVAISLESRHLGLISTMTPQELQSRINKVSCVISPHLNTKMLIDIANNACDLLLPSSITSTPTSIHASMPTHNNLYPYPYGVSTPASPITSPITSPKNTPTKKYNTPTTHTTTPSNQNTRHTPPVIAVALDESFNFYYSENFDALCSKGATLSFFSPVHDPCPPSDCDGLYIGGGFPEILSQPLAKNESMKKSIKKLAESGLPIYAECGGLMYLTKSITSADNHHQKEMVGLFDAKTQMTLRPVLNYTKACMKESLSQQHPLSNMTHTPFHGHEFHYSVLSDVAPDSTFAFSIQRGHGIKDQMDGLVTYNTLASYGHLYFDSSSGSALSFVTSCVRHSKK